MNVGGLKGGHEEHGIQVEPEVEASLNSVGTVTLNSLSTTLTFSFLIGRLVFVIVDLDLNVFKTLLNLDADIFAVLILA